MIDHRIRGKKYFDDQWTRRGVRSVLNVLVGG